MTTASPRRGRVVVAMSGGVDSSVAAALLREQGHEVVAVTLRLRDCAEARESRSCCGSDGVARARAAAGQLGIRHYVLDCARELEEQVLRPAWDDYARGRTPSPCLLCNERIKFAVLLSWARQLGADLLATGHYARLEHDGDGRPSLVRAADRDKDQSYFLAGLRRDQLAPVLFPIGHLTKKGVRELARSLGLPNADAEDSQDACLVEAGQSFAEMLRQRFRGERRPGPIVDRDGRVLGEHAGIHQFTVGQRKGLRISSASRCWVKAVRDEDGAVVVTADERELYRDRLVAVGMSWIDGSPSRRDLGCEVQVRYRHAPEAARIEVRPDGAVVVCFERPVRAITPGQAAVFYDGPRALGRGWIHSHG